MKSKRTAKLLIALLSSALLLTAAFGVTSLTTAAADDATPVIVSKNVSYEGALHLYYAIPKTASVTAENTTLSIYDADPALSGANLINTYTGSIEKIESLGNEEYIVFRTGGIAAKDMAKYVYAQAESAGNKGDVVRYSVLEYLYERLYTNEHTEVQAKLYNATLQYGIAAQAALTNTPLEVETPIDELCYVYVNPNMGTVDGTNYSGIYETGTNLTLNYTGTDPFGVWALKNITADGESESTLEGNSLTVSNTVIISTAEKAEADPDARPAYTFDTAGEIPTGVRVTGWNGANTTPSVTVADGKMTVDSNQAGVKDIISFSPTEIATGKIKSWVFEADITSVGTPTDSALSDGNSYFLFRDNSVGKEHKVQIGLRSGAGQGIWFQAYSGEKYGAVSGTPAVDSTEFHFKAEYKIVDGKGSVEISINGTSYGSISDPSRDVIDLAAVNMFRIEIGYNFINKMTFDNVQLYPTLTTDARPSYNFNNGQMPAGMHPYYWDSAAGASVASDYTVADGKFTVNSLAGRNDTIRFFPTETAVADGETMNSWVFESKITSIGTTPGGACYFSFRDNSSGNDYRIQVGFRNAAGSALWWQAETKANGNSISGTAAVDSTEFHLRMEYFIDEYEADGAAKTRGCARFYINGAYVGEVYDNTASNIVAIDAINMFRIEIASDTVTTLIFDDVRFYPAETADPAN